MFENRLINPPPPTQFLPVWGRSGDSCTQAYSYFAIIITTIWTKTSKREQCVFIYFFLLNQVTKFHNLLFVFNCQILYTIGIISSIYTKDLINPFVHCNKYLKTKGHHGRTFSLLVLNYSKGFPGSRNVL